MAKVRVFTSESGHVVVADTEGIRAEDMPLLEEAIKEGKLEPGSRLVEAEEGHKLIRECPGCREAPREIFRP